MARRYDHNREELQALAIAAGYQILEEEGMESLSMRKIAQAMGYTVGTLYNLFEDYYDLMLHLNAQSLDALQLVLQEAREPHLSGVVAVQNMAQAYLGFAREHTHLWHAIFHLPHPEDRSLPEWYSAKIEEVFAHIVPLLLPVVGQDSKAAQLHATRLWASVHGVCVLHVTGRTERLETESPFAMADAVIDCYIKGLSV